MGYIIHASVDTFARKLYLTNDTDALLKLKSLLDLFFSIEQFRNGIDLRYDAFFAALLQEGKNAIKVPDNIRIITWNYDFQIELSLCNFMQIKDSRLLENYVNIFPTVKNELFNYNKFSIVKINGSSMGNIFVDGKFRNTGFDPTLIKDKFLHDNIINPLDNLFFDYFRKVYLSHPDTKIDPAILYSWEKEKIALDARTHAKQIMMVTDYLIVIGYSFPIFNRSIDRELLQSLRASAKIYIQAPLNDIESVEQRFQALSSHNNVPNSVTQTDEFFIPFEYQ